MVELAVTDGKLTLHVKGMDELWALKSTLEIPLAHIARVHADAGGCARLVPRLENAGDQCAWGDYGRDVLPGWQASILGRSPSGEDDCD